MSSLENKTFDEIKIGDTASAERALRPRDVHAWAAASGLPADGNRGEDAVGLATAVFVSLVASDLPGPGSYVRSTAVQALSTLPIDAVLKAQIVVREKKADEHLVVLEGECTDPAGHKIATARLEVVAPTTRLMREVPKHRLEGLLDQCRGLKPMVTGVVHPCSAEALTGAVEAAEAGLIEPVLFAPADELHEVATSAKLDLKNYRIVATDGPEDSAQKAAMAAGATEVQALMKGSLHTDVLLHAVMEKEAKLRTQRLLSHCALVSVPTYARRVVISDVALNIAPDTDQKRDICQNAIGFARALGIELPKVAILAAVETVHTRMPATTDGAILTKMADRRQILGGVVDGPLDLDAAVDATAAATKQITSPVAGAADVLIAPNIEAGNMVYKDLAFMADAQTAGLVVGARVPVILTSRADTAAARLYSAATAVLYAEALARDPSDILPEL